MHEEVPLFTAKNAHLTYPLFSVSLSPLTSQVWNAAHTLTIIQIVTRPSTHTLFSFNKRWELTTVEHACAQTAHRGPESWDPWTWFRCFLTDYLSSTQDTLTAAKAVRDNRWLIKIQRKPYPNFCRTYCIEETWTRFLYTNKHYMWGRLVNAQTLL